MQKIPIAIQCNYQYSVFPKICFIIYNCKWYIFEKLKNKDIYEGQSKYVILLYIIFCERTILKEASRKNLLTDAA